MLYDKMVILEVMEMYCRNCGQYVSDDMLYCPRCGYQLLQAKRICYYCKNPLRENEDICPCCGKSQTKTMPEDRFKGYWKKPILWIILIVLMAGSLYVSDYISSHPLNLQSTVSTNMKISGEMDENMIGANNQSEGFAYINGQKLYCIKNHNLYQVDLNNDLQMKKLIDGCQGYIYVNGQQLYYCDTYYDYYCYNLETGQKEKLLENIYYPIINKNQIFYQLDEDGESVHCYDMETHQDQKLNDEISYALSIDSKHQQLYYLGYDNEKYTIKSMNFNGDNLQEVYQCNGDATYVMDDDYIYVYDEDQIIKVAKDDGKQQVLKEHLLTGYINICQDQIIYSSNGLYKMSKDGKDNEQLYDDYVYSMQVVGDQVIMTSYVEYEKAMQVVDLDGQVTNLFLQEQTEQFEDLEEV